MFNPGQVIRHKASGEKVVVAEFNAQVQKYLLSSGSVSSGSAWTSANEIVSHDKQFVETCFVADEQPTKGSGATIRVRLVENGDEGIPIVDDVRDSNPNVYGKLILTDEVRRNLVEGGVEVKLSPGWKTVDGKKRLRCVQLDLS